MNEQMVNIGDLVFYLHEKTGMKISTIAEIVNFSMEFLIEKELLERSEN